MDTPDFTESLVFTGGGTGGHFFPALALAEAAHSLWPDRPIAFVGARRGIEAQRLPASPWPHLLLEVEGLLGRSPIRLLCAITKLARTRQILLRRWRSERPFAIVGTGGYAAAPALLAARALGIPYFLHESNAAPGALVRLLARGARRVWCGMEAVQARLPGADCRVVGTPVRAAFLRPFAAPEALPPPRRILVLGGSGGARAINDALLACAPGLLAAHPDWEILHQTGPGDYARIQELPRHPRHQVLPFLETPDLAMESAALVISRSGASTCTELKVCGRPALLVPFPGAAADHQTVNAQAMADEGRAILLVQGPELAQRLEIEASRLMADPGARARLSHPEPNSAVQRCLEDLEAALLR